MSIHIEAPKGAIAENILLPGDPLRAKAIALRFFENPVLVNSVRGMLAYTGSFRGQPVSVMGTGMGIPSHSIYVSELLEFYSCKRLIRVGTCGSFSQELPLRALVLPNGATTDSGVAATWFQGLSYSAVPSFSLLSRGSQAAQGLQLTPHVCGIFTSDLFYNHKTPDITALLSQYGVAAVDMESYALFCLAQRFGAEALSICTVSDHLLTGEQTSSADRQESFDSMTELALATLFSA